MSVHELQRLHGRYASLSNQFRSAWAFHQYLDSLRKVFAVGPAAAEVSAEFQSVYSELKSISGRLSASDAGAIESELDAVEERLRALSAALVRQDNKVSPPQVRHFFQRVKNQDENILTQLVKFYVHSQDGAEWAGDRLDKVDFLLTTLAQERDATGRYGLIERGRLREIVTGLWNLQDVRDAPESVIEGATAELRGLREEAAACANLEELNERRLVARFRDFKHGLGRHLFHPKVLLESLETNLLYKNLIRQLYAVEERRIAAEYQGIFDLEREAPVEPELAEELRRFRHDVELFERRLQADELKLSELASIRSQVRSLASRLGRSSPEPEPSPEEPESADGAAGGALLADALERLTTALAETDSDLPAARVAITSEVYSLRLEPREVDAYRFLAGTGGRAGTSGNRDLETLVLEAAATRVALDDRVEEIKALLDDTATTGEAPVFARTRKTLALASGHLARLEAAGERATVQGRITEAQELLLLRMRLLRNYAGAWLLAVAPVIRGRHKV
jgi:hypothetical protein